MKSSTYLEFEDRFRGERNSIIKQFKNYDKLINLAIKDIDEPKMLDIGCGRGEWLQYWSNLIPNSYGIEIDHSMIEICRDFGLNIIEGDAIEAIKKIKDNTISIITIFHVIEHLEQDILSNIILECNRVLNDNGLLIIETPSIDNLTVSTKSFYLDPTHINHINPEGISFLIEKAGFSKVKYYYIHGGPLENTDPWKLSRIFNGVGQDLLILATKNEPTQNKIFVDNKSWEDDLDIAISTIQAVVDHDLDLLDKINQIGKYKNEFLKKIESNTSLIESNTSLIEQYHLEIKPEIIQLNHEIYALKEQKDKLKNEIFSLKEDLKYVFYLLNILRKIFNPFRNFLRLVKQIILYTCNKIFNILARYKFTQVILKKRISLKVINFFLKNLLGKQSTINVAQIESKATHVQNKYNKNVHKYSSDHRLNNQLYSHFKNSINAKEYKKLFGRHLFKK